ncbi:MAG: pyrroline-5-carboxylate reductase [Candidatus Omnitrophota bacterium]|nr:pyrroline-5-carboxylate reductase [Candidatus Omnitrophota bacterium]
MLKIFRKKIGIIGFGNMGAAIAARIKGKYRLFVFDKVAAKLAGLTGVCALNSAAEVADKADAVILAVKPQDFEAALIEIKDKTAGKLIISIAAGITTKYIENILGAIRVIRIMPNIGAIAAKSLTYICKGHYALDGDLMFADGLFRSIGSVFVIEENMMDAATAVGGSGPGFWGFLFDQQPREKWEEYKKNYFIPEFIAAAKSVGFDEEKAAAAADSISSASMSAIEALHITPAELSKRVASKGGTTEAGLEVLKNGGSLAQAVQAALRRAKELSQYIK